MQKIGQPRGCPKGDRVIPDFEITPGDGGAIARGLGGKSHACHGNHQQGQSQCCGNGDGDYANDSFLFQSKHLQTKKYNKSFKCSLHKACAKLCGNCAQMGDFKGFLPVAAKLCRKKGEHFCRENEKEQVNQRPCFAAWALMCSQLSSLKSCSIRQASARAFSGETPSACSRAVRTRWRS